MMKRYYLIVELSGHCGASCCYSVEILSQEEWEVLQRQMEEKLNLNSERCPYCGMLEVEQIKRYIIDDIVEANNKTEAEELFRKKIYERFGERVEEYSTFEEILKEYYTR